MSSPFQKQFSSKNPMSPLNGAYTEGRDRNINTYRPSEREYFDKLQSDITSATSDAMQPKLSKCEALRNNWHAGKMTDKAYADASKNCGEEIDKGGLKEGFGGAQTQAGYDYFNDPNIPKGND